MGAMLIECIETRVESSSSDLPVANHVTIYWTPDSVIYVWCFNRNINSSQYFWSYARVLLTDEIHMELTFDRCSIVYLCDTIGSPSKSLGFMVSEVKYFLYLVVLTLHF